MKTKNVNECYNTDNIELYREKRAQRDDFWEKVVVEQKQILLKYVFTRTCDSF
jgi:hypothetical protein